jgi:hypothetical protein
MNFVISAEFGMIELMDCIEKCMSEIKILFPSFAKKRGKEILLYLFCVANYLSKCQRGVPRTYYKDYNTISV